MRRKITYNIAQSMIIDHNNSVYPLPEVNELDINLSQLRYNYDIIRKMIDSKVKLMSILKGDAYGHGMIPIAYELEECKCDAFGVVRLCEAVALREAGIKIPIYLLAPVSPKQAPWLIKHNITVMIDNEELIKALHNVCIEENKNVKVHIKINTGLNRFGLEPEKSMDFIRMLHKDYPHIEVEGIYTHFQNPDYNQQFTREQINHFNDVLKQLEQVDLRPTIAHAAGSTGILRYTEAHYDMVRCGVLLFGLEHTIGEKKIPEGIKPLMTLKGRVLKIRDIQAGEYGGYGNAYIAEKNITTAIIGMGYADGISRGWKEVLLGGRRVLVMNYFMDGIMVDITEIKDKIKEFDEAVFIGTQGKETLDWGEICKWFGTYEDEQIQHITGRVPKHYYYE